MTLLIIANFSDRRCGFQNFATQAVQAFRRAGHDVRTWDGTYAAIYERQQQGLGNGAFIPADIGQCDRVLFIHHPLTMNHYSGAAFPQDVPIDLWNGGPADSYCPFEQAFTGHRWAPFERYGYRHDCWYPIPDWIDDLPEPDRPFTVGLTGVREEGFAEVIDACSTIGARVNRGEPGAWIPVDDEIRRLARSTVNVCWYSAKHPDRSGGVMMALASKRPQVVTDVPMFWHLADQDDLIWDHGHPIAHILSRLKMEWEQAPLRGKSELQFPQATFEKFRWARMVERFEEAWR